MRLLIADDEVVIRTGLLSLDWKSIGIEEVLSVINGEEARALLETVHIDIALLDIRMPGMTGLQLAELVKEKSMDTAVLLLTGFSDFGYAREAIRNNVYEYLLKPVNPKELLNAVLDVKIRLEQKRYQRNLVNRYEESEGSFDTVQQVKNHFSKTSQSIRPLLLDIAKDFSQSVSLNQLAEKYHFASSYLSKKIKQETGYSFIDILIAVRLMNAAKFLQDGNKINVACEKAGFNDQRYFSQIFKRVFKCTPSDYKKELHNPSDIKFYLVLERVAKNRGVSENEGSAS